MSASAVWPVQSRIGFGLAGFWNSGHEDIGIEKPQVCSMIIEIALLYARFYKLNLLRSD